MKMLEMQRDRWGSAFQQHSGEMLTQCCSACVSLLVDGHEGLKPSPAAAKSLEELPANRLRANIPLRMLQGLQGQDTGACRTRCCRF